MARILIALADRDFDTTEVVQPWRVLTEAGHEVVFSTESGHQAACDPLLLTGVLFGQLGAKPDSVALYHKLEHTKSFCEPSEWSKLRATDFDALILPGGHAPGMRQYLESSTLQTLVRSFYEQDKPIGAICHGPLVLARTKTERGESVIAGRTLTCLPFWMEALAYGISAWKLGKYYRTYDAYVQREIEEAVGSQGTFLRGPLSNRYNRPFVVSDQNLITARWPGDAVAFAHRLRERVEEAEGQ